MFHPPTLSPHSYLEVVRDATPSDYDNEELYQTMEKLYIVVRYIYLTSFTMYTSYR